MLARRARETLAVDVVEAFRRVDVPVLVLGASADRVVPARAFEDFARCKPEAERVVLEGPHLLLQRRPVQAAREIVRFLDACGD